MTEKKEVQSEGAARPQGGAVAPSPVSPIVPRQVSRKAGAADAPRKETPNSEAASQPPCQLVGISWTSPMGLSNPSDLEKILIPKTFWKRLKAALLVLCGKQMVLQTRGEKRRQREWLKQSHKYNSDLENSAKQSL